MGRLALILALVMIFVGAGAAQVPTTPLKIVSGQAYVASTNDTLVAKKMSGAKHLSLQVTSHDSAAFDIYIQYAQTATGSYSTIKTDSLITTTATGATREILVRGSATDNYAEKLMGFTRVVIAPRADGNGVTTATYDAIWNYSR